MRERVGSAGGFDQRARAAEAIAEADAMVIAAGAGMGVDSGLPDFRGDEGFWKAYPPFAERGLSFIDLASPSWFAEDPELGWGFYGHRLGLYREIQPHAGFELLRAWGLGMTHGARVFTSNVDGQFQRAGFPEQTVVECHGSIHHLQCSEACESRIWPAHEICVQVDEASFRAAPPLPRCPTCGAVARPNILMFGDWAWLPERTGSQQEQLGAWLDGLGRARLVVVEIGAGMAVPTVRLVAERLAARPGAMLIRINPREPSVPEGHVSIAGGGLEALEGIGALLEVRQA